MTRVPDDALAELDCHGFVVVEGFLAGAELREAQAGFHDDFPTLEQLENDVARYGYLREGQFTGNRSGPFRSLAVNRIAHHEHLLDAAERFCGTSDIELYKTELWAKYGDGVDYEQDLHRDYGNHSIVVPREDRRWPQMTTFVLLSDVTAADGPTMVVPRPCSARVPLHVRRDPDDSHDLRRHEVPVLGPAGSLFIYTTDVFHRGSSIEPGRHRFAVLFDYMEAGPRWQGRKRWADTANQFDEWNAILGDATPRQREIYGFPPVGHPYWNEQTARDVGERWPAIDMSPYRSGIRSDLTGTPPARRRRRTGRAR